MKTLKGKITIGKTSSRDGDYVMIELEDSLSHCRVVEVRMSIEDFGQAILGLACQKCEFDLNDSGVIGKTHEYKEEVVPVPDDFNSHGGNFEKLAAKALAPFEVDGWVGRKEDLKNFHRVERKGNKISYRVSFVRYV